MGVFMIEQTTQLIQRERQEKDRLRAELQECRKVNGEMRREIALLTRRYLDLRREVQG
jgi:hypothetical protein